MNTAVGDPRVGQWYARWDSGEIFQVIGQDIASCTIDRRAFGGTLDSIDEVTWAALPLAWLESPEGWIDPRTASAGGEDTPAQQTVSAIEWAEPMVG